MAISTDFNYADILSLDSAKLVGLKRLNSLGSKELVLNYNNIASATKADCVEWLDANRRNITDPTFGFKTYEGLWVCIDISFDEDSKIIQQRFKVDSSIGNLGDTDDEPDYSLQTGDLSRISDGMDVQKAYYWRVASPDGIDLPSTPIDGEIWSKTANDNGDGTFDVVVSREVAKNQVGYNYTRSNGYNEEAEVSTNNDPQSFVSDGGTIPDPIGGEIKSIQNNPSENGKYKTSITVRENNNLSASSSAQAGGDNGAWTESTDIDTNSSTEASLPSISDGQVATVTNRPNQDGTFTTTTTVRTFQSQRFPQIDETAQTGQVFSYYSDFLPRANILIIGKNRTQAEFITDSEFTGYNDAWDQDGRTITVFEMISNISVQINDVGLYDYVITARYPG